VWNYITCQIRNIVTVSGKKNFVRQIGEKLKKITLSYMLFIVHFEATIVPLSPKF
jgi:hypothetical protein